MTTGETFLQYFNKIEHALREKSGKEEPGRSFYDLVETVAKHDVVVRRNKALLKSFARLRNAIVHDVEYPERILADPREDIVEEIRAVFETLTTPRLLIPAFQRNIRVFDSGEALSECLRYMKEHDFSQVVLKSHGKHRLLSSEGIVKWLENARDIGLADLEQATVGDAWEFEDEHICQYLPRHAPVEAVFETFEQAIKRGIPRLQAVLVTHTGKPEEHPLGIVTPWDLLKET